MRIMRDCRSNTSECWGYADKAHRNEQLFDNIVNAFIGI